MDLDVQIISSSLDDIKSLQKNDEILHVALFSKAKNGFYSIKLCQLFDVIYIIKILY